MTLPVPTWEEILIAEKEVVDFVQYLLKEYSEKTGYPVPTLKLGYVRVFFEYVLTAYNAATKEIIFDNRWAGDLWARMRAEMEKFLRYAIAQEFWHYVQHLEGRIITDLKYVHKMRPLIEAEARAKAEVLSGISRKEMEELAKELTLM